MLQYFGWKVHQNGVFWTHLGFSCFFSAVKGTFQGSGQTKDQLHWDIKVTLESSRSVKTKSFDLYTQALLIHKNQTAILMQLGNALTLVQTKYSALTRLNHNNVYTVRLNRIGYIYISYTV